MRYHEMMEKCRNMKKQMKKVALALAFVLGVTQLMPVLASTVDKAKDKKNQAEEGLTSTKNEIGNSEKQQEALKKDMPWIRSLCR